MATQIYDIKNITLLNGEVLECSPLKIKYLREFMLLFENVKSTSNDYDAISALSECARVAMKQYYPEISKSAEIFEEYVDLKIIYDILEISAGVKINKESEEPVKNQAVNSQSSWDELDLARLESEVFLLGIWKDYDHLERSLSMQELTATLSSKRELDYQEKKFFAAIQGVDLDKQAGKSNAWEDMKARVFSKGKATDASDIVSLQGINAQKAGFGIGMGLGYEVVDQ